LLNGVFHVFHVFLGVLKVLAVTFAHVFGDVFTEVVVSIVRNV
jgi:hypothetical protein